LAEIDVAHKPVVTYGTMFIYGLGRAAEAVKSRVFETFLFFYYVQVLEVPGTYAGLAVGVALAFDAVTDPFMGSFSDRFKSRWGRRHPFMFLSMFPLTITFLFLMIPPDGMTSIQLAVWLGVFAVLVRASITLFHVPHLSLAPELVSEYDRRTTLVVIRNIMGILGSATAFFVGFNYFFASTPEFANGQLNVEAYPPFAVAMTILMVGAIFFCVFGTRKQIPYLNPPISSRQFKFSDIYIDIAVSLRSKSFRSIFLAMVFFAIYAGVHSTMSLHMGTYFWELSPREFTIYALSVLFGALFGLPVAHFSIRQFDKKPAYLALISLSVILTTAPVVLRLIGWFPDNNHQLFFPVFLTFIFFGTTCGLAAGTASASMVMDTTDEHELLTGNRQEGAFYGAISLAGKAASAFGHIVGGFVIDLINFPLGSDVKPGSVDADIIWQLGFYFGPMVALLPVFAIWIISSYNISRKRHNEILVELGR
jgi:Na+/melibiose symporter-like transporter